VEDLSDGRLDSFTLADAALIASGIDTEAGLARYRPKLEAIVSAAVAGVRKQNVPVRKARRLLEELHRSALRRYETSSDRFADLLDTGVYNCVSASLLYIIAARAAGLNPDVAETPLHVFVVLKAADRNIDIETTSPTGFDVRRDLADFRSFILANKYVTPEELSQRGVEAIFNEFNNLTHPVSPENAIAFLYHNAGIRALQTGDPGAAARNLIDAVRIYPKLGYRSDDLRKTLAWSVREQYDAGNYIGAFDVAEVAMRMLPDRTTVRERFIAVGARLVEDSATHQDMEAAAQYEERMRALLPDEADWRRVEAWTAPVLARAAVLARDWPAARRHAARFRAAATDPVEAERFITWVESRVAEGGAANAVPGLDHEVKAALASVPGGQDPHDYAAVVRGIAALAEQGRFDEALAVGKVQRTLLEGAGASGGSGLDDLLKAVAGRQVATLLHDRRWKEAETAVAEALARWPADGQLIALRQEAGALMARDPWRLSVWPSAIVARGTSGAGAPRAGGSLRPAASRR